MVCVLVSCPVWFSVYADKSILQYSANSDSNIFLPSHCKITPDFYELNWSLENRDLKVVKIVVKLFLFWWLVSTYHLTSPENWFECSVREVWCAGWRLEGGSDMWSHVSITPCHLVTEPEPSNRPELGERDASLCHLPVLCFSRLSWRSQGQH